MSYTAELCISGQSQNYCYVIETIYTGPDRRAAAYAASQSYEEWAERCFRTGQIGITRVSRNGKPLHCWDA